VGTVGTLGIVNYYAGDLPSIDALQSSNLAQATTITDRSGYLIDRLYAENRTVEPLSKISPLLQKATVATEDRSFYQHQGVDYRRLLIAAAFDLTHGSAVSFSGRLYDFQAYTVSEATGRLDYDDVRRRAREVSPKMIVAGYSSYPRRLDFAAFADIAEQGTIVPSSAVAQNAVDRRRWEPEAL